MTKHGLRIVLGYAQRILEHHGRSSPASMEALNWIESNDRALGICLPPWMEEMPAHRLRRMRIARSTWDALLGEVSTRITTLRNARPGRFEANLKEVADALGLDSIERGILELFCRVALEEANVDSLIRDVVTDGGCEVFEALAVALGSSKAKVMHRLRDDSKLLRCGLLGSDSCGLRFCVPVGLNLSLLPPKRGLEDFRRDFLGKPAKTDLEWEDFAHLGQARDFASDLLAGAIKSGARGINILFHGESGTGKTEFCKVLSARLGLKLYSVGECDGVSDELDRSHRLMRLRLAQQLAGKGTMLLFDEMEDLLESGGFSFFGMRIGSSHGSKVFGNRLLESNPVPVLWTSNDIQSFDPALLRRMTAVIEMRTPTAQVRKRIWQRALKKEHVALPEAEVEALSRDFNVAPAVTANAARAARLTGGGAERVRLAVELLDRAMSVGTGGKQAERRKTPIPFQEDLASADQDLGELCRRLAASGRLDFSLLLSGPAGTGKSLYARHLAEALGLEVIQRRASDLMSPWVGQTEQQIAAAFQQARDARALLVFDEADSLLSSREQAMRSWEVSQVNEMLTWMESHPLPFVCTTNLSQRLDPASMRRFTFKVAFGYLSEQQASMAFERFFGMKAPLGLANLRQLTPADFAVVRSKAAILGYLEDGEALLRMLEAECAVKPEMGKVVGFR